MKNFISFVAALILTSFPAFAEDVSPRNLSIGLGGGPTLGGGFIGRYEWENKWGIQATTLPYFTADSALIIEGLSATYALDKNPRGGVYFSIGGIGWHRMQTEYIWPVIEGKVDGNGNPLPPQNVNPTKIRSWSNGFAVGPGLGFKFNFFENYVFSIDLPAAIVFEVKEGKIIFDSLRPWPNIALMYNF